MTGPSAPKTRRRGRRYLHLDDLPLMLFVDVGRALSRRSVNAFCNRNSFRGTGGRKYTRATLKRRYYQRRAWLQPARWPWGELEPNPLAKAYQQFLDEVVAVFASP